MSNRRSILSSCLACTLVLCVCLFISAAPARLLTRVHAQSVSMQAQAQKAAKLPIKLDVRPMSQSARVDQQISVQVVLLDANNKPENWGKPCQVTVTLKEPSGKIDTYSLTIPAGQTSSQINVTPHEKGLVLLTASEANQRLLSGGNSLLVIAPTSPAPATRGRAGGTISQITSLAPSSDSLFQPVSFHVDPGEQAPPAASPGGISLLLTNSSGKDEILADGKDFAKIQIYYMDPQGAPAPTNIKVWLSPSNGDIVGGQPIVIPKGQMSAEADWISQSPVDATITFVNSGPAFPVQSASTFKVSFVPPIYGVGSPDTDPVKVSLIDCVPVTAQFFDNDGHSVQTSKTRRITFVSSSPLLQLDPAAQDVLPPQSGASIFLIPTWSGTSSVDIWTPGYDHVTLQVQVTIWLVLALCVAGGILGGIAAKDALKGTVAWRIFVGVVGAIVLVWFGVYAVLPETHNIIAHNQISVFVVGILGGYSGTRALDFVGKKLGYF